MTVAKYDHDPEATLDYSLDWSIYLPTGDTLTNAVWTIYDTMWAAPGAETITLTRQSFNNQTAVVWISGGTAVAGQKFYVTCHVTTTGGRQDDRTIQITVKEE